MMRRFLLAAACALSLPAAAQATWRPNLYLDQLLLVQPAAFPEDGAVRQDLTLYARARFIDNPLADRSVRLAAAWQGRVGEAGFVQAGLGRQTGSYYARHGLSLGYGRRFAFGEGHWLEAAVRALAYVDDLRLDEVPHVADAEASGLALTPDLDLGLRYAWRGLRTSVSVRHAAASRVERDGAALIANRRETHLLLGWAFDAGPRWRLMPYGYAVAERNLDLDLGFRAALAERLDLTYALRLTELRHVGMLGVHLGNGARVALAVDRSHLYGDVHGDLLLGWRF